MDDQSQSAKKINAMKARQNFGQMLEEVYYRGEQFVIERAGRPMAALIPLSKLDELQKHTSAARPEHNQLKEKKSQTKKRKA
jgi:prevent-host-death family protein